MAGKLERLNMTLNGIEAELLRRQNAALRDALDVATGQEDGEDDEVSMEGDDSGDFDGDDGADDAGDDDYDALGSDDDSEPA